MAKVILADEVASGIYQIRNLVNGKRYIGSAVSFASRWRQHRCELGKGRHNPHLQNAWLKYGEAAFVFEIIEAVADAAQLIAREQHYFDTLQPEYNVAKIAGSNFGIRWAEDVKVKMRAASKAVWERPGHRQRMSDAHMGQQCSAEQRKKMSEALRGRKLSVSHAAIVAKNNGERNRSESHRQIMSAFWKGRPKTPEQIAKMAASKTGMPAHNKGKPASDEQKAKQSAAMKAKYASDPSLRDRVSQATRAAMLRPDVASKVSAANLGRKQSDATKLKRAESIRRTCAERRKS